MNTPRKKAKFVLASVASLSLGLLAAHEASATSYTFTGTGEWYTAGTSPNWSPTVTNGLTSNTLNTAGNSVIINGVVDYNAAAAGGDFLVGNGDTMTIDGSSGTASWTQALGTSNWCKIGASGGSSVTSTVDVLNGGTFNMYCNGQQFRVGLDGGAGQFIMESTGGGLNIAGSVGGTAYSNSLQVASGSSVSLRGGTNTLGEINSSGTVTFGGGTTTTGQWDNAAAVYNVTGGTVTGTNYDMNTAGATLNASGGTLNFTGNFTNLRTVTINGAAISVAGTLNTNASTNVTMTSGSLTKTGTGNFNLNAAATFTLSGTAAFNMPGGGEFQPGATFTAGSNSIQSINGNATINIMGLTAFQGGATTKFDINGGALTIGASAYNGIYSSGGYFNFTMGSTGEIDLANVNMTNAIADISGNKIRYNDTTYTAANYSSVFTVTSDGGNGTLIYLLGNGGGAVPEPSTWLGGGLLLGVVGFIKRSRIAAGLRTLRHRFV